MTFRNVRAHDQKTELSGPWTVTVMYVFEKKNKIDICLSKRALKNYTFNLRLSYTLTRYEIATCV